MMIVEDSDDTEEILSMALTEEYTGGGIVGNVNIIDALDSDDTESALSANQGRILNETKGDNLIIEGGLLYLTANNKKLNKPIALPGVGGIVLNLQNLCSSSFSTSFGSDCFLEFNVSSLDTGNGNETGKVSIVYFVNNRRVASTNIDQGEIKYNISQYLSLGENTVKVQVTDSYENTKYLNYTIEAINLSIVSYFDYTNIQDSEFELRFTPYGNISKVIHILIDGREIERITTTVSGRSMSTTIPKQSHGAHKLRLYISSEIAGQIIISNYLDFEFIAIEAGNNNPIISSSFLQSEARQFDTVVIKYQVYTPSSLVSSVTLKKGDTVINNIEVPRSEQIFSYRLKEAGQNKLKIATGNIEKEFIINVISNNLPEAENLGLELYLTSADRYNTETDTREIWNFDTISATFNNLGWVTDGWVLDNFNNNVLRIPEYASVTIPFKIFDKDFKIAGKTIEFELSTKEVTNYDSPLINIFSGGKGIQISAQNLLFKSELTEIKTQFKEEEIVRLSLVICPTYEDCLIYTYINGIISGVKQYSGDDSFSQSVPVNITLGGEGATLDIYNIRVYEGSLNNDQILGNYIGDLADIDKKISLFESNNILDGNGNIDYVYTVNRIPCMTFIGTMPSFKGDKKTISVEYENLQDQTKSFSLAQCQIDVQGTSSQYYPRKNWKIKGKSNFILADGTENSKYTLRDSSLPVGTFCLKADFAESSGTHNTGLACYVDQLLRDMNFLTPPMIQDNRLRTTIDGFPIVLFHKETAESEPVFVGKYNFNNDKSTEDTFGFSEGAECWEICNNTSSRVLFQESDYTKLDANNNPDWLNDFEGRYPDASEDYTNLKVLTDWIVSCKNNPTKFKQEAEYHFNLNYLLFYYIVTELFGGVDQRAKNCMLASWGNEGTGAFKWYPIFYDNDTIIGLNNEGANVFSYDIEFHDIIGSQNVFNGAGSSLWANVEIAYKTEIENMYRLMRSSEALSYEKAIQFFNIEQCDKWSETIYNIDARFKYIDPLLNKEGDYLYAGQGSREEHRIWWLYNRFRYIDSKYSAGSFNNDYVTMRLYTPTVWGGIEPNADFTLIPYTDGYCRVKFGSNIISARSVKNEVQQIIAPEITFNDTETIIYGASRLLSIGDLSGKYAGTIDLSKAQRLTELKIGSDAVGYQNTNLHRLNIGANKMLRSIDIQGCSILTDPLEVSGCTNLESIKAKGSGISSVKLSDSGNIKFLHLPSTISNLTLKNQKYLTRDNLILEGTDNISTCILENMNHLDPISFIETLIPKKLERCRLIGIDAEVENDGFLYRLSRIKGIDENGFDTERSIVTGKIVIDEIYDTTAQLFRQWFPYLEITYKTAKPEILFESPIVTELMLSNWDANNDLHITQDELDEVTNIALKFKNKQILSFPEFKLFRFLESIPDEAFKGNKLTKLELPISISSIGDNCFDRNLELWINSSSITLGFNSLDNLKVYANSNVWASCLLQSNNKLDIIGFFEYPDQTVLPNLYNNLYHTTKWYSDKECTNEINVGNGNIVYCKLGRKQSKINITINRPLGVTDNTILTIEPAPINLTQIDFDNWEADVYHGEYVISATNTQTYEFSESIDITQAQTITRTLPRIPDLIIRAEDGILGQPMGGLKVTIGSITKTTDASGEVKFSLKPAKYEVEIEYLGKTYKNECVMGDSDTTYTFPITQDLSCLSTETCFVCQDMTSTVGASFIIRTASGSGTLSIDWGDGTIEEKNISATNITCSHLYGTLTNNLTYIVKISSSVNHYLNYCKGVLYAYQLASNCTKVDSLFHTNTKLRSVHKDLFKYNGSLLTNLDSAFYYCNSLKAIPECLLDPCINITSMVNTFYYCSSISILPKDLLLFNTKLRNVQNCFVRDNFASIPNEFFKSCSYLNTISGCFNSCSKLIEVPEDLLSYTSSITSAYYLFHDCTNLATVPTNLFRTNPNISNFNSTFKNTKISNIEGLLDPITTAITNMSYTFNGCKNITSIPSNLFSKVTGAGDITYCFANTSITSVPSGLLSSCTQIKSVAGLFYGCLGITTVPEGLLNNCTEITNANYLFYSSGITTVPENIFRFNTKITSIAFLFSGTKSLVTVPSGLFRNNTLITSCTYLFQSSSISSVPSGLFSNTTLIKDLQSLFSYCTNLKSVPYTLFENLTELTDIRNLFSYSGIENLHSDLFINNTKITTARAICYDCKSLVSVGAGLFRNCSELANIEMAFYNNKALTTIGTGLFDNNTKLINVSNMLYGCSALDQIYNLTSSGKKTLWERNGDSEGLQVTSYSSFCTSANATFRATVPTAWGGTYTPPATMSLSQSDYDSLLARIENLENQ